MKEKWVVIAKDNDAPYMRNRYFTECFYIWKKELKLPFIRLGVISHRNSIEYITIPSDWKRTSEAFSRRVEKDIKVLWRTVERFSKWGNKMNQETIKIYRKNLKKCTPRQLISYYKKLSYYQTHDYAYGILLPLLDIGGVSFVEDKIKDYLKKNVPAKDFQKCYAAFTYPAHDSFAEEEEKDLLNIYKNIYRNDKLKEKIKKYDAREAVELIRKKYPSISKKLKVHTNRYAWVYYVYQGPAYTETDFIDAIKDFISRRINPGQEILKRISRREKIEERQEKYLEKLNPDLYMREMLNFVSYMIWSKPRRKDFQSKSYWHAEKLLREIGRRLDLALYQVRSVPYEMLEAALLGRKNINLRKIQQIEEKHILLPTPLFKTKLIVGSKVDEFIRKNVKREKKKKSIRTLIKGDIACEGGIIRGRAKIINRPQNMGKMNYGDILVSAATTPSIVPAMKKAAAIVTDEGGLTCHAAITSREMNTPCVIGTSIASEVLKDGEMLEVDAKNGIIRKVRK